MTGINDVNDFYGCKIKHLYTSPLNHRSFSQRNTENSNLNKCLSVVNIGKGFSIETRVLDPQSLLDQERQLLKDGRLRLIIISQV